MLVLSRKRNESIVIGEDIRVTVVSINGNQVRLGIQAPGDIRVMREELLIRFEEAPTSALANREPARRRLTASARS
jgi:carbon storage regulator